MSWPQLRQFEVRMTGSPASKHCIYAYSERSFKHLQGVPGVGLASLLKVPSPAVPEGVRVKGNKEKKVVFRTRLIGLTWFIWFVIKVTLDCILSRICGRCSHNHGWPVTTSCKLQQQTQWLVLKQLYYSDSKNSKRNMCHNSVSMSTKQRRIKAPQE